MCPELVPERTLKKFLFSVSVTYEQCAFRAKMTVHASRLSGVPVQLDLRVIIYIVKVRCGTVLARYGTCTPAGSPVGHCDGAWISRSRSR